MTAIRRTGPAQVRRFLQGLDNDTQDADIVHRERLMARLVEGGDALGDRGRRCLGDDALVRERYGSAEYDELKSRHLAQGSPTDEKDPWQAHRVECRAKCGGFSGPCTNCRTPLAMY